MQSRPTLVRLCLAAILLGSLAACAIVPAYPPYPTYPAYRYGYPNAYYEPDRRYYDGRGSRYYQEERRIQSPLEGAARMHRDVRRSLGLPRLPGMP